MAKGTTETNGVGKTTTKTNGSATWQELAARKQKQSRDAIPQAWRLSSEFIENDNDNNDNNNDKIKNGNNNKTENENNNETKNENKKAFSLFDVPRQSGIMTDREIEVTENYSVRELLAELAAGRATAVEVTTAFSKRAAIAQQLTSCLTEIFFEEARERAKYLDELRSQGQLAGPLHGLPISVKDTFKVVGYDATVGFAEFVGATATNNSALVDVLLQLGAVLYVKTNVPQGLMSADSENNLFGRTLNPWNTALTAGGSSGGEGALVAFRGSPLGVGTDVAGSIRIPSSCCGTYGFKPTAGRMPDGKQAFGIKAGMGFILPSLGPLANDLDALEVFARAVIDAVPAKFDSDCFDLPWRMDNRVAGKTKLRIGMLPEDPIYPTHPPVRRALQEAVAKLTMAGHEVVSISPEQTRLADASEVGVQLLCLDGTTMSHLENMGEPPVQSLINGGKGMQSMKFTYTDGLAELERLDRLAALDVKRLEIRESWREIWTQYNIDAVITPTAQSTAVPHDTFFSAPYTFLLNILNYPACVIPFQTVRSELDGESMHMQPGQMGADYEPTLLHGAPCSVQVFTNKMRDEECLAVARMVDDCLRA